MSNSLTDHAPLPNTDLLLARAMSNDVLAQAYEWLCKQRRDYSPNSDIWIFRQQWEETKCVFVQQVLSGSYAFSPLHRYHIDGETVTCWAAQDALLLKAMTLTLSTVLTPHLPPCCYHLAGKGGIKAAVSEVQQHLQAGDFVMRTDVKGFYDNIEHFPLYETLNEWVDDKAFCRLVWQSLQHTVIFEGAYQAVEKGLSRSHPMSPLLGALALLPLDLVMADLPVFYCRYMDDWVIVAKSRWGLRRAIRAMHGVLNRLHFVLHPDKTSIGRVDHGFDFLGYHLTLDGLQLAGITLNRLRERLHRLYEQQAPEERLNAYVRHWLSALCGGGELFRPLKREWGDVYGYQRCGGGTVSSRPLSSPIIS